MTVILDLFGDPISDGIGRRGRPPHVPTSANRNKVAMLLALGWGNERIANALSISLPTLRKCYRAEMKARIIMRDRMDARVAEKLWDGVNDGNIGAIKEFRRFLERNDQMTAERSFMTRDDRPAPEARVEKLGKKEAAQIAAQTAGEGSEWGSDLMMTNRRAN